VGCSSAIILPEDRRISMSISENLLPEFDQEMANTRRLLECVPEK
jgi:hypothetical protein